MMRHNVFISRLFYFHDLWLYEVKINKIALSLSLGKTFLYQELNFDTVFHDL